MQSRIGDIFKHISAWFHFWYLCRIICWPVALICAITVHLLVVGQLGNLQYRYTLFVWRRVKYTKQFYTHVDARAIISASFIFFGYTWPTHIGPSFVVHESILLRTIGLQTTMATQGSFTLNHSGTFSVMHYQASRRWIIVDFVFNVIGVTIEVIAKQCTTPFPRAPPSTSPPLANPVNGSEQLKPNSHIYLSWLSPYLTKIQSLHCEHISH